MESLAEYFLSLPVSKAKDYTKYTNNLEVPFNGKMTILKNRENRYFLDS